jgi:hypothetical protein
MDSWNLGRRDPPDGEQRSQLEPERTIGGLSMKPKQAGALPEKTGYTKYFEHDGALRAYANRMMWFGISAVMISFVLALLVFYVRVQPPTVIRIAANGEASVVSGATTTPRTPLGFMAALAAASAPGEQPADIEGRAVVRRFLENYLTYTPTTMEKNWADALNLMTHNLRTLTLDQLRDQDIVSKVHDDEITSTFKLRSLEPVKGQPWTYIAFGVKEVHRVHNKAEFTDRLVARYNVRLLQTERSERVPSGLLVAEYGETQMVGEKDSGLEQSSALMDGQKH